MVYPAGVGSAGGAPVVIHECCCYDKSEKEIAQDTLDELGE
jgi:hypothetical protein